MSITACCPACGTTFRVAPEQLRASDGWVRCGRCSRVFDTVEPAEAAVDDSDDAPWTGPVPAAALRNLPSLDLGVPLAPVDVLPPAPLPVPQIVVPAFEPPTTAEAPVVPAVAVLRQADQPASNADGASRNQADAASVARSARERLGATASPAPAPAPRRRLRIAVAVGLAVLVFAALLALRWRDTLCSWVACSA